MPLIKKTVLVHEKVQYEVRVEVDAALGDDAVEAIALDKFLQREDHTEGFIAVLDRDVCVEKPA